MQILRKNRSCSASRTGQFEFFLRVLRSWGLASTAAISITTVLAVAYSSVGSSNSASVVNQVGIVGTVYLWRGNSSVPQDGVEIVVRQDGKNIAGGHSSDGRRFAFQLAKGAPVILVFRYTGYAEGRVICGPTDRDNQTINMTLLSYQDAEKRWGDSAREFFHRPVMIGKK